MYPVPRIDQFGQPLCTVSDYNVPIPETHWHSRRSVDEVEYGRARSRKKQDARDLAAKEALKALEEELLRKVSSFDRAVKVATDIE